MGIPIRSRGFVLALLLAALTVPAPVCLAGNTLWGVGGFGSFNTYAMSDVNDEIDVLNILLSAAGLAPMDNVNDGIGYGGGIRAIFNDKVMASLDYERLTGSTSVTDGIDRLEYDLPCDAVLATVAYRFPGAGKVRFGLGGGIGYYSSAASLSVDASSIGESGKGDLTGSGVGFHGVGLMDVVLSPAVHLEAQAGYRYGKTGDITIEAAGQSQELSDYSLDWSGFMSRLGLAVYFGAGK